MLFDLRKKMMLMIKDISELVQGRTLCKSCSMGVTTSDWEKKGCPFGGGGRWGQSDFSPIPLDCSSTPVMLIHKI